MKTTTIIFIIFLTLNIYSQEESKKSAPIIFGEYTFGIGREINAYGGFFSGGELNYQFKNKLFTLRYIDYMLLKSDMLFVTPFTPLPFIKEKINNKEIGLLYGKRWIYDGSSISFSGGLSLNYHLNRSTNEQFNIKDNYVGFPFEFNIKWFKSKKKRYRIYGIIPIGKPTSFGRNFGFKFVGNISKHSFVAFGIVYGFGIHKKY